MRHKKQGFALIAAIFILVILGVLSAFVVNISAITHRTTTYALEGARALFAARSGLEWATQQVVSNPTSCPSNTTLHLTQSGASGFDVAVTCTATSFTEGNNTFNLFEISSVASRGAFGTVDFVSREMKVFVTLGS